MAFVATTGIEPARRRELRRGLEVVLAAVLMAVFARAYVLQGFTVPSPSMSPTLLVGDYLLVNKFIFASQWLAIERRFLPQRLVNRGDLVVFKFPGGATQDYVKRCIGLPGDLVALRSGQVWINGELRREALGGGVEWVADFGPLVVPPGQYFVLGDHRGDSSDSRDWGTVPASYIKGRPVVVYWSRGADAPTSEVVVRWRRLLAQVR